MVDASNAFNNLNCKVALVNIYHSCPSIPTILINTYRQESALYIDGETILSKEGMTQGDPLAMAMFAIAMVPLINKVKGDECQCWYANDTSAGGKLRSWWDKVLQYGPEYGYFPNPEKSWLVVKEHMEEAHNIFGTPGVQITNQGRQYIGAPTGSEGFVEAFVKMKAEAWSEAAKKLSGFAKTPPHAAYAAFGHGLHHRWTFLFCTAPNVEHLLRPLENAIHYHLLPTITGRDDINDKM